MMPDMFYYNYPYMNRKKLKKHKDRLITVVGIGKVEVEPDIIVINMGVTTQDTDVVKAQDDNKTKMNKVIDGLRRDGVSQNDIKTTQFSVTPRYNYVDGKQEFIGYVVNNVIQVTVRDMDQVGMIIENALKNGVNNQRGLNYTVSEPEIYYEEALELAVINAREKAQNIAMTLQSNINMRPIKVIEKTNRDQISPREGQYMVVDGGVPVRAGTMQIVAKVEATFEYE